MKKLKKLSALFFAAVFAFCMLTPAFAETADETPDYNISICGYLDGKEMGKEITVNYGTKLKIVARCDNLPASYCIAIFEGYTILSEGDSNECSYMTGEIKEDTVFTAKIINKSTGEIISEAESVTVAVKGNGAGTEIDKSFIQRLIDFLYMVIEWLKSML